MQPTIQDRQRFEPSTSRMRITARPTVLRKVCWLCQESNPVPPLVQFLYQQSFASITFTKCSYLVRCKILSAMSLRRCKNGAGVGAVMVDIKIDTALVVGGGGDKGEGVCW